MTDPMTPERLAEHVTSRMLPIPAMTKIGTPGRYSRDRATDTGALLAPCYQPGSATVTTHARSGDDRTCAPSWRCVSAYRLRGGERPGRCPMTREDLTVAGLSLLIWAVTIYLVAGVANMLDGLP